MTTLSSCKSDDDSSSIDGNIIGSWCTSDLNSQNLTIAQITFKSDGSYLGVAFTLSGKDLVDSNGAVDMEKVTDATRTETKGTFTANNGKITITVNGNTESGSYSITSTTFEGESAKALNITMPDGSKKFYNSAKLNAQFLVAEAVYKTYSK